MEMTHRVYEQLQNELIAQQLRRYVGAGAHKHISWDDLADLTRIKAPTLRSYAATPPTTMSAPTMMVIFAHLPAAAWAKVNAAMGFCAPPRLEDEEAACMRRVLAQASQLVADGNEYLADGVIDHLERAEFSDKAEALIPVLRAHIIKD